MRLLVIFQYHFADPESSNGISALQLMGTIHPTLRSRFNSFSLLNSQKKFRTSNLSLSRCWTKNVAQFDDHRLSNGSTPSLHDEFQYQKITPVLDEYTNFNIRLGHSLWDFTLH
jgi:hypothetical protein